MQNAITYMDTLKARPQIIFSNTAARWRWEENSQGAKMAVEQENMPIARHRE